MGRSTSAVPVTARPWLLLSIVMAAVAMIASVVALADASIYAVLTAGFLPQAVAQDLVNLFLVSPAVVVLAVLAMRGSAPAAVLWLGTLLFTAYNYVIYTVAIPFGPLFLPWVGVLGASLFAALGGCACIDRRELLVTFRDARAVRAGAVTLIVLTVLFALLWLSEDLPALLSGTTPATITDLGVITNPVHVLDLAFFLPATALVAVLCLRGERRAATLVPSFLVFMLLTAIPILVTPVVQVARGDAATSGAVAPIGVVAVVVLGLLAWLTRTAGAADGRSPTSA